MQFLDGVAVAEGQSLDERLYADAANAVLALESAAADWGALIDPTEYLRDDSGFGAPIGPQSVRSDRANGDNFPIFRSEAELGIIRAIGRAMVDCTEHGQAIVATMQSYIIGCGFQWVVDPRNAADGTAKTLAGVVQAAITVFLKREKWQCNKEDESLLRAVRDGEVFIAIMDRPGGGLCVRLIEPAQVTEPQPSVAAAICERYGLEYGNWSYGIHTRDGDVEDVQGYFVQWTDRPDDWSYIPESRMVHWKRNVDSNVKRGLSDFYPTRNGMRGSGKLQSRLTGGAAVQASIAWVQEMPEGTTKAQAEGVVRAMASGTEVIPAPASANQTGTRQFRDVTRLSANSAITTGYGQKFLPGPMGHAEKATGFVEVLASQLRTLGVRWQLPEFIISGDASNANYASTLASSSPFGRARERDQFKFGQVQEEFTLKYLAVMCTKGDFQEFGVDSLATLLQSVTLTYTAPPVQVQDEGEKLDNAERKLRLGVKRELVMRELGYTPADMETSGTQPAAGGEDGTTPAGAAPAPAGGTTPPLMASMSRLQQSRNFSSVLDVLNRVANKKATPQAAAILLKQLGVSDDDAAALLTDAADGKLDTVPPAAVGESMDSRMETIRITVESVHCHRLPKESAEVMLVELCDVPQEQAAKMLANAGTDKTLTDWWTDK